MAARAVLVMRMRVHVARVVVIMNVVVIVRMGVIMNVVVMMVAVSMAVIVCVSVVVIVRMGVILSVMVVMMLRVCDPMAQALQKHPRSEKKNGQPRDHSQDFGNLFRNDEPE